MCSQFQFLAEEQEFPATGTCTQWLLPRYFKSVFPLFRFSTEMIKRTNALLKFYFNCFPHLYNTYSLWLLSKVKGLTGEFLWIQAY